MKKAVFIDRDGVINSDVGHYYIYRPDDFILNAGVIETLSLLQNAGYLLIVVSNQGGVDKGIYSLEDVVLVHQKMKALLLEAGITLDAIYFCPHHDEVQKCLCRKPLPLNIEKALVRFDIDRKQSWMIGDSERDILAGKAAGLRTIRIESNENMYSTVQSLIILGQQA